MASWIEKNMGGLWHELKRIWVVYGMNWKEYGWFMAWIEKNMGGLWHELKRIRVVYDMNWKEYG